MENQQEDLSQIYSKKNTLGKKCNVFQKFILLNIKTLVMVYGLLTFPIYLVIQRPWKNLRKKVKILRVDPTDLYSPILRLPEKSIMPPHIRTLENLFNHLRSKNGDKKCFGTRAILKETYEDPKHKGKITKIVQADQYEWITFNEADKKIKLICSSLQALNIPSKTKVAIFAETRVEWMLIAQACFRMNLPIVTLFYSFEKSGIVHVMNHTEVKHLFTSSELVEKIINLLPQMHFLKNIIYMESPFKLTFGDLGPVQVFSFSEFLKLADQAPKESKIQSPKQDDLAIIVFTSGSTGTPKGVLILHSNLIFITRSITSTLKKKQFKSYIAYLPLAQIMEICIEMTALICGATIAYSSPLTLTSMSSGIIDGRLGDMTVAKPYGLAAVPLVLTMLRNGILNHVNEKGPFFSALFKYFMNYKIFWYRWGFNAPILDRVMFKKIRRLMGGKLKLMAASGAPLSQETHEFISACLGVNILPAYGITEVTGSATLGFVGDRTTGHSGFPLPGVYFKLIDWVEGGYYVTDKPNPRGEICVGGGSVSAGYFKNDNLTQELFKFENGIQWFQSGDIGEMLPNGAIVIIDRKKDLVKLSNGEYIALGKIEAVIKTCPYVNNICVVAHRAKDFLIALVLPNKKKLFELAEHLGKNSVSTDLYSDPDIVKQFTKAIHEQSEHGNLSSFEIPRFVKLCSEEWSPENQFVTATMKIRRKKVEIYYRKEIETLFSPDGLSSVSV